MNMYYSDVLRPLLLLSTAFTTAQAWAKPDLTGWVQSRKAVIRLCDRSDNGVLKNSGNID
jgi:hypothetical protein